MLRPALPLRLAARRQALLPERRGGITEGGTAVGNRMRAEGGIEEGGALEVIAVGEVATVLTGDALPRRVVSELRRIGS